MLVKIEANDLGEILEQFRDQLGARIQSVVGAQLWEHINETWPEWTAVDFDAMLAQVAEVASKEGWADKPDTCSMTWQEIGACRTEELVAAFKMIEYMTAVYDPLEHTEFDEPIGFSADRLVEAVEKLQEAIRKARLCADETSKEFDESLWLHDEEGEEIAVGLYGLAADYGENYRRALAGYVVARQAEALLAGLPVYE